MKIGRDTKRGGGEESEVMQHEYAYVNQFQPKITERGVDGEESEVHEYACISEPPKSSCGKVQWLLQSFPPETVICPILAPPPEGRQPGRQ